MLQIYSLLYEMVKIDPLPVNEKIIVKLSTLLKNIATLHVNMIDADPKRYHLKVKTVHKSLA